MPQPNPQQPKMGTTKQLPVTMRNLEKLEENVMEALVSDIRDCQDPIDQFKLIERYAAFCDARATRLESEKSQG
jgi:hypothetical protein